MSQDFKMARLVFICIIPLRLVFTYNVPGAGELITGPTLLGDPMAAGNLICASPPYLITTDKQTKELLLVCAQLGVRVNLSVYKETDLKKALVAH